MEEAMVMAFAAKDDEESEEEKSDVLADLGTTDDDDVSDGATNAWDVLSAMDAARRMVLAAENSFMVGRIVMIYYSCGDDIMVKRYLDVMILSANGWIGSVMIMQLEPKIADLLRICKIRSLENGTPCSSRDHQLTKEK
jgi:hypothetical protein